MRESASSPADDRPGSIRRAHEQLRQIEQLVHQLWRELDAREALWQAQSERWKRMNERP